MKWTAYRIDENRIGIKDENENIICVIDDPGSQAEDNARKIAALPELLLRAELLTAELHNRKVRMPNTAIGMTLELEKAVKQAKAWYKIPWGSELD